MKQYGLIGKKLGHSFSKQYFTQKFQELNTDAEYLLFERDSLKGFREWLSKNPLIGGLNITIPYKTEIIPCLDEISDEALKIGAVNTIKITENGKIKGYNTDVYGFEATLLNGKKAQNRDSFPSKALILGTGGASKAVQFVLEKWGIPFQLISRRQGKGILVYENLLSESLPDDILIINSTPLGMYPDTDLSPDFPYEKLNASHWLIDLIYNPEYTLFLQKGMRKGAFVQNGLEMLYLQAEKAWEIWQSR